MDPVRLKDQQFTLIHVGKLPRMQCTNPVGIVKMRGSWSEHSKLKKKKKKNLDSPLKKDMQYQLECKALSVTYTFNMLEKDVSTKVDNSNQPSLL